MTPLARDLAYRMIYAGCEPEPGRYTSDLPITADVWLQFASERQFDEAIDLLLTPHSRANPTLLREMVSSHLTGMADSAPFIASSESHLLARLNFFQMLRLLPLTSWWSRNIADNRENGRRVALLGDIAASLKSRAATAGLAREVLRHVQSVETLSSFKNVGKLVAAASIPASAAHKSALVRLVNVAALFVGLSLLGLGRDSIPQSALEAQIRRAAAKVLGVLAQCCRLSDEGEGRAAPPLWLIASNRPAQHALESSLRTMKADAASRVFDTGGGGVRWAVIDSGIDATHPAFGGSALLSKPELQQDSRDPRRSRIVRTLDFTRLAALTGGALSPEQQQQLANRPDGAELLARARRLPRDLAQGRMLDWGMLEPLLQVPHEPERYIQPVDSHGTHVAGILGAGWYGRHYLDQGLPLPGELAQIDDLLGVCPNIEMLDLRVFDALGKSDEFTILAALQYVRFLNQSRGKQYVHGVNLSLSLRHEVRSYGCGSTPVCLECNSLVGSGVVVVAAAGNFGYDTAYSDVHLGGAYRGQSLTDPGNAEAVITVGSTHRSDPHLYGVSYFSSRGPTGDGRLKPDLVAPGEKVLSTIPNARLAAMDGTSMAAPHVSGAAALLLSRNSELMGQPQRVKDILAQSATDLGRDRTFQGHGLVDALRALQSI